MTPLVFVVAVLATYRTTLLITADKITEDLRERTLDRLGAYDDDGIPLPEEEQAHPKLVYLVDCPWCASAHIAPLFMLSAVWWGSGAGWWVICGGLAASGATGFLASFASPES